MRFYALGYVLNYWHAKTLGTSAAVARPLPPRTEMDPRYVRSQPRTPTERQQRHDDASKGQFTSLRQYGKYNNLTQYGSVFNAQALIRIAEGASDGDFSGHICLTKNAAHLIEQVKGLIDRQCPVIIPYDVSVARNTAGDPTHESGKAAHWTTIVGYDEAPPGTLNFLHYTWGGYYRSLAEAFAKSCRCLSSNLNKDFLKCDIRRSTNSGTTWQLDERSWMAKEDVDMVFTTPLKGTFRFAGAQWTKTSEKGDEVIAENTKSKTHLLKVTRLGSGKNMEYNDPAVSWTGELDFSTILYPDYYKKNFVNPGLRGKLVAIYPAASSADFR